MHSGQTGEVYIITMLRHTLCFKYVNMFPSSFTLILNYLWSEFIVYIYIYVVSDWCGLSQNKVWRNETNYSPGNIFIYSSLYLCVCLPYGDSSSKLTQFLIYQYRCDRRRKPTRCCQRVLRSRCIFHPFPNKKTSRVEGHLNVFVKNMRSLQGECMTSATTSWCDNSILSRGSREKHHI